MENKKIGLVLANPETNYGAHLQAFATQCIIDKLGVQTEIIDFTAVKSGMHVYFCWGLFQSVFTSIKKRLIKSKDISEEVYDDQFNAEVRSRTKIAKDFRAKFLHDVKVVKTYDSLVKLASTYDAVLIGSDQMWLPGVSLGPRNSLRFVPKGVKRLSYSTSLGVSTYPKRYWASARDMWINMNAISVREEQGAKIIREICDNKVDVQVVCDPTYLLTKEQWEEQIPVKTMCDEKYVFCYFLGDDKAQKLCAKRYAKENGLQLVYVLSCESYSDIDRNFADKTISSATPEQFMNWVRGAECVFTDSFHGLAFSVINHKQFYVFYRVRKDSKLSRNSRIDNILNMWGVSERLILNPYDKWSSKLIDYNAVEKKVTEKRNESLDYLKKALEL